ncbi:hypothetical protein MNBD_GAMMA10-2493 [hydrothermal vent metagenome]|uniref:Uncharacterized protein n=1 Tax=hydrothermal vent metagenome TaxID=652676 RepID=A0A3B0Y022_9ZZZZ
MQAAGTCRFKVEITDLSYVEMIIDDTNTENNNECIKYLRNIVEIYHADVEVKNKFLTKEILETAKKIIIETVNAASEFIKIDDLKSAQLFISMKLYKDFLKYGFRTAEIPTIDIIKTHNTGEWINVESLLSVN